MTDESIFVIPFFFSFSFLVLFIKEVRVDDPRNKKKCKDKNGMNLNIG